MPTASGELVERVLDLAWSQWTDLGVRGTTTALHSWSIDPEALLLLTASLSDLDPRLRDESLDWCIANMRYISRHRLRSLARNLRDEDARAATTRYGATLARAGARGWSEGAKPWPFEPTGKATLADLRLPNLIRLRLRAIFGVSARAEIFHALSWQSGEWTSSVQLATLAGYTKRNIDEEVESLHRAGLVEVVYERNRRLVRLARRDRLEGFVGAVPTRFPDWPAIMGALISVLDLERRVSNAGARVRDVEASALIESLDARGVVPSLPALPPLGPSDTAKRLDEWVTALLRDLLETT